jgi:hypothetical protein
MTRLVDRSSEDLRAMLTTCETLAPIDAHDAKQLAHTATKIRWVLESRERLARLLRSAA